MRALVEASIEGRVSWTDRRAPGQYFAAELGAGSAEVVLAADEHDARPSLTSAHRRDERVRAAIFSAAACAGAKERDAADGAAKPRLVFVSSGAVLAFMEFLHGKVNSTSIAYATRV